MQEGGRGACLWEDFQKLAAPEAITAQGEWCSTCNNTKMDACAGAPAPLALNPTCAHACTYARTHSPSMLPCFSVRQSVIPWAAGGTVRRSCNVRVCLALLMPAR